MSEPNPAASLPLDRPALEAACLRALEIARARGASDAEVETSAAVGQSVTVRLGEVETVEYNRDKGLAVTVYFGQRRGNASTSDVSDAGQPLPPERKTGLRRPTCSRATRPMGG